VLRVHKAENAHRRNIGLRRKAEYGLLLAFSSCLQLLPVSTVRRLARLIADFSFSVLRIRRGVAVENLKNAFPEKDTRWIIRVARDSNRNLFISLFELFILPKFTIDELKKNITFRNPGVFEEVYRRKRGLIIMSGHFGSWELFAMSMPVLLNFQASIIVKRQRNYYTDTFLNKYRSQYGNRIVYTKDSVRETLRVLRDNGVVAIIADQSGPKDSIYVPFFGRSVATFGGPALFALRTGASIIMILSIRREDGTYEAVFEEVLQDGLNGSEADRVRELTARHTAVLEKYIRQYPHLWLWQHRRWKHVLDETEESEE
jgi:Kdo2-lipid IVA lauroyltransferase/acyltransferase